MANAKKSPMDDLFVAASRLGERGLARVGQIIDHLQLRLRGDRLRVSEDIRAASPLRSNSQASAIERSELHAQVASGDMITAWKAVAERTAATIPARVT